MERKVGSDGAVSISFPPEESTVNRTTGRVSSHIEEPVNVLLGAKVKAIVTYVDNQIEILVDHRKAGGADSNLPGGLELNPPYHTNISGFLATPGAHDCEFRIFEWAGSDGSVGDWRADFEIHVWDKLVKSYTVSGTAPMWSGPGLKYVVHVPIVAITPAAQTSL